ncbi:MAG: M23 family metallopeptidase [Phenylobacterium sp.]
MRRRAGWGGDDGRGAPVRASAAGEVVYAGDQVPGFGNLVLIKHPDGWVTAYAHLSNVDVKIQQKVMQGQQIGEAGDTGGVAEPQLHFEIRYAPTPTERARPSAAAQRAAAETRSGRGRLLIEPRERRARAGWREATSRARAPAVAAATPLAPTAVPADPMRQGPQAALRARARPARQVIGRHPLAP